MRPTLFLLLRAPGGKRHRLRCASSTPHIVVCEHREKERLRFEETRQVAQRQTKIRQPVLVNEDLTVFRFEGPDQLLRLWIKLLVQQLYDQWRKASSIGRRRF